MLPDALFLGEDARGIFIAAKGNVRAALCVQLRERVLHRLEGATPIPVVYADLSECVYMDSTFIGLLVAFDKRLKGSAGARLHVLSPSPECREILRSLGLEGYLLLETRLLSLPEAMEEMDDAEKPAAELLLHAHEELMSTSEHLKEKFGLLKEMLQKKINDEGLQKPPEDNPSE